MSGSPFSRAKELYDGVELEAIVAYCAHNGFVYADKKVFLCAYPTHSSLIETESKQPIEIQSKKELDKADTWYVYVASGDLNRAFEVIRPLKYVAFRRMDSRFRLFDFERMRRLIWQTQQH